MYIQDFLSRLRVERGPNANGEYMCQCPAHNDRTASLSVRTGDDGNLLVKCMAGCDTRDVVKTMGLTMRDLFNSDGPRTLRREEKPKTVGASSGKKKGKASDTLGELKKVYSYCDESGQEIFQVCRFEKIEDGERVKTFRQRRYAPDDPGAKGGYIWNLNGVRSVVYRLPEILAAIQAGETIYLVEGEKDVETLECLGLHATTNAGGAVMTGRPKWTKEHTEALRGAKRIVVLEDNDDTGRNDRQRVALQLSTVCDDVRLLDLRNIDPELPEHGDITDLLERMGSDAGLQALHQLEEATEPIDSSQARSMAERERVLELINGMDGYCVQDGCISQWTSDGAAKKLCTFSGLVTGILEQDDGIEVRRSMVIDAWRSDGQKLPQVVVKAGDFARMNWVESNWDVRAAVLPGTTQRDKVRYVMSQAGMTQVKRMVEFGHTGWRRVGGRWCYLYHGGAIGADGVQVRLQNGLERYCFDAGAEAPTDERAQLWMASMITTVIPRRISVPMTGLVFLAPLREALEAAGCPPSFVMFLRGGTGIGKTTISALWMAYFGTRFGSTNMVATYSDTVNSLRRKAFWLKDTVMVIDDYHPEGNLQARRRLEDTAQQLVRAYGDLAGRDRQSAEGGLAGTPPPRSLALTSGEDMPNVRESGQARYYTIDIKKGEVPIEVTADKHDELQEMQELAREGGMARLMKAYIEWLIPQMDQLPKKLRSRWLEMREVLQGQGLGHARSAGAVAHLLLGYEMYLRFLLQKGVVPGIDKQWCGDEMRLAIEDIVSNAKAQGREAVEERPTRMYVNSIREMLLTHDAYVEDLVPGGEDKPKGRAAHIGYRDDRYYYLLPQASYTAVFEQYSKRGESFPLSIRMLGKQMAEDGLITVDASGRKSARVKMIHGKPVRAFWVARTVIDEDAENTQLGLAVEDPDNPFTETKEAET